MATTLDYEKQYWQQNINLIAGIDEVGMGALVGPVVAAAVIFNNDDYKKILKLGVRDSKKLSAKRREVLFSKIKEAAQAWSIAEASAQEIDKINIRNAAHLAMRRAVEKLNIKPELLLIDGNPAQPHKKIPATNIIGGDDLSCSIAAASILAKVFRDNIMFKLEKICPNYGFSSHKGYGTKEHLIALKEYGPCKYHRKTYAPVAKCLIPLD